MLSGRAVPGRPERDRIGSAGPDDWSLTCRNLRVGTAIVSLRIGPLKPSGSPPSFWSLSQRSSCGGCSGLTGS